MIRRFIFTILAAACGLICSARAEPEFEALSGESFTLGGEEFHLTDVIAPSAADAGGGKPFADEARRSLAALLSRGVRVESDVDTDRWSRRAAKAYRGSETLQELLVAAGLARVSPESADSDFIGRLLVLEGDARAAGRGLWRDRRYQIFDAADAQFAPGGFAIVEGSILKAVAGRGRVYLNFGEDYRTDFTVTARSADARRWQKSGFDLLALEGLRIRVRGYAAFINGPSIEVQHQQQIEILEKAAAGE